MYVQAAGRVEAGLGSVDPATAHPDVIGSTSPACHFRTGGAPRSSPAERTEAESGHRFDRSPGHRFGHGEIAENRENGILATIQHANENE